MMRKRREREEFEGKATQFFIDGVEVPPEKLVRYQNRKGKNKKVNEGTADASEFALNWLLQHLNANSSN